MNKLLLSILITVMSLLSFSTISSRTFAIDPLNQVCTHAQQTNANLTPTVCQGTDSTPGSTNPVYTILKIVIDLLSAIVGLASVIIIIVQGIRLVTSQGDPKALETARNAIIYASLGVLIAVMAQVFVAFVLTRFST